MADSNHFYLRDQIYTKNLPELSDKSIQSLSVSKSLHTMDAYESDWNDFCDWCRFHHESSFPASPETIVNYINDLADNAKISTVRRRISAISENFNAGGLRSETNPCRAWIVKEALSGLGRRIGAAQKGKTPIYWEELRKMVSLMDENDLSDIRDKAILLVGFMGAFRRSELSGLEVNDISRVPKGIIINIVHSKTDQTQMGQQVGIPYIPDSHMCAVTALNTWLTKANITDGSVFRGLLRNGQPSPKRLSDKSINLIIKKHAKRIGLFPDLYGAHSLRHGFATYAASKQIEERLIMKQTRHRSVEMVRHYINEADLFTNNPIALMFGQETSADK